MRMCRMSILVRAGRASCPACGSSGSAAVRDEVALPCVTSVSNQGAYIAGLSAGGAEGRVHKIESRKLSVCLDRRRWARRTNK